MEDYKCRRAHDLNRKDLKTIKLFPALSNARDEFLSGIAHTEPDEQLDVLNDSRPDYFPKVSGRSPRKMLEGMLKKESKSKLALVSKPGSYAPVLKYEKFVEGNKKSPEARNKNLKNTLQSPKGQNKIPGSTFGKVAS